MAGNKSKPQAKKNGIITELVYFYMVVNCYNTEKPQIKEENGLEI